MGFLDHSTNNIIIDAVLTDRGRELLATQGAAFAITRFTLADDEVDYTLVQKFGRTVGREKIIKNTPIFEAQTLETIAIKNKLKTLNSATKRYMPSLNIEGTSFSQSNKLLTVDHTLGSQSNPTKTLSITLSKTGNESLVTELVDTQFDIVANSDLMDIKSVSGGNFSSTTDSVTKQKTFVVNSDQTGLSESGGKLIEFKVSSKNTITTDVFDLHSDPTNPNQITTVVSVIGASSGLRQDFTVQINKVT